MNLPKERELRLKETVIFLVFLTPSKASACFLGFNVHLFPLPEGILNMDRIGTAVSR
jgi:hypothetical protein